MVRTDNNRNHQARLINEPGVFLIANSKFNAEGLHDWVEHRGLKEDENWLTSPIKSIVEGASTQYQGQEESEIISEFGGRFCFDSFCKGRRSDEYAQNIIESRHGSVLQHATFSFAIDGVSRSLTHELIRHNVGVARSQESQRYVDANNIRFIVPPLFLYSWGGDTECSEADDFLAENMRCLENYEMAQEYLKMFLTDQHPDLPKFEVRKRVNEAARSMLPNCCETKIFWTGNIQALRWLCEQRGAGPAELEIRRLGVVLAKKLKEVAPYTFFDCEIEPGEFGVDTVKFANSKV